jgi:hypothetical protein
VGNIQDLVAVAHQIPQTRGFFVSLPPMAYLLNLVVPNKFSMIIWDVYPDIFKITGMKESHPLYRIWSWGNKKSFKKAYKLFTIGEKMADLIAVYVDRSKIIVQPIWSIFQKNERIAKDKNPLWRRMNSKANLSCNIRETLGLRTK